MPTKSGFLGEVQKSCYRCHGKLRNGKPRIEGDFDLTALLEKDSLSIDDSLNWLKVFEEVKAKRMPPEDVKEELSDSSRKKWQRYLAVKLATKNLQPRMLTAKEINNDHSLAFGYNSEFYDPFETLKLHKVSDARYSTIKSADLMSRSFMESLQYGLEELIQDYTQSAHGTARSHTMKVGETSQATVRANVTNAVEIINGVDQKKGFSKSGGHFEFRIWGRQRLYFKTHPGQGTPAGHYRISFKAKTLDRLRIAELKKKYESEGKRGERNLAELMKDWQDLLYSKARISLVNSGNRTKQATDDGVFHTFQIEDEKEQTYSCDFTLKTLAHLDLSFDNGTYNGRKHWVRFGGERQKKGEEYVFPRVEIYDVQVTKLNELETKNPYDLSFQKDSSLDQQKMLQNLYAYAESLGMGDKQKLVSQLYAELPTSLSNREKYSAILKLLSMSSEYLYLDYNKNDKEAARFVSYALLKTKADDDFSKDYSNFKKSRLSAQKFAGKIVQDPFFESFLEEFTEGWLQYDVDLDLKKFNKKVQAVDDQEETVAYLRFIFANNRPLSEVFQSDYKILDSNLSPYYELPDSSKVGFKKYDKIKGGVLQQMAFFRSQSDGIDGLPFRRAQWISENVFNQRLGNSPNDVSSEEFEAGKDLKTFRERTEFHSNHTGCYSCHKDLDPIAFAVNHRGTLGDLVHAPETEFISQFTKRLQETEKEQVKAFAKNLLQFITGRNLTVYDYLVIEKFIKDHAKTNFKSADFLAHTLKYYFK